MIEIMLLLLIGSLSGFFSGLLGLGGGVVLIPLLIYGAGLDISSAAAVSMVFILFASLSGVLGHYRLGNIKSQIGILMGAASLAGCFFAGYYSGMIPEFVLQLLFIMVVVSAALMLLQNRTNIYSKEEKPVKIIPTVLIGFLKGVLTGMLGIGGGFIVVPLMIYFLGLPIHHAIGTSLVVNFLAAIAGISGKFVALDLELGLTWWVIAASIPGVQVGCHMASKASPRMLRYFLLILLIIILISMLYDLSLFFA